ncbi:hypothetical protein IIQ_05507 [Bacillus cereus VD118]|uniref:Uncharacterized protein n=1 Tax=Bacillus cereus VD118 TaxID=1053231 RepID=R8QYT1_BACCE|nr:hypothetical protein IIQ_05507 [Bacillus cereus VD118]
MSQINLHIKLSLIQLFLLVLNLFILSSAMPFLSWFMESAFGWLGILATTPLLHPLFHYVLCYYLLWNYRL